MNPNLCQLNKFELNDDGLNLVDVQTSSLGIPNGVQLNNDNINIISNRITDYINQNLDQYINCNIDNVFNRVSKDSGFHNVDDLKNYFNKINNKIKFILFIIGSILFIIPIINLFISLLNLLKLRKYKN